MRRITPNNLSNHDTRDNILLAQASTNVPAVKPVITIDYPKINTGYSPIVHNDDLIREGNPLRFDIKTLTQLRPNVDLNLRITQSSNYLEGKPTQAIRGRFTRQNPESEPDPYNTEITLTNESSITTFGWRIPYIRIRVLTDIGTVTIELLPGEGYELDPSNQPLEYRIDGNFTPIMQILAEDYSIVEGEPAKVPNRLE